MSLTHAPEPGSSMSSLHDFAARYNFAKPVISDNSITFTHKAAGMTFTSDSRQMLFNNTLIWLNTPIATSGKKWFVDKADIKTMLEPLLKPSACITADKPGVIVLDAGHGGNDEGATGSNKTIEKELVLDIAKRTQAILLKNGMNTKLTREADRYISLSKRSALADSMQADVFVSIHLNFAANKNAAGIETYIMTPSGLLSTSLSKPDKRVYEGNKQDIENTILAYLVHREMLNSAQAEDRGIKHARFKVIRDLSCPAILIECGFLSSVKEEAKLNTADYRNRIAEGIAAGIRNYVGLHSNTKK